MSERRPPDFRVEDGDVAYSIWVSRDGSGPFAMLYISERQGNMWRTVKKLRANAVPQPWVMVRVAFTKEGMKNESISATIRNLMFRLLPKNEKREHLIVECDRNRCVFCGKRIEGGW